MSGIGLGIILHLTADAPESNFVSPSAAQEVKDRPYQRIVSLAPSITECLFALGLGNRVMGVTNYCDYPPEALTKSKIGGYYDLNLEAVVALCPDLVICLPEHADHLADLERLGLSYLTVDHRHVATILESLMILGHTCGVPERAKSLVQEIRKRMTTVRKCVVDGERPSVLVCVGRNMGSATIDDVYVAGHAGFYDEMITLAGGTNAYQGNLAFPLVTGEGLLRLKPEIIIDMVADLSENGLTEAEVLQQWDSSPDLPAVKQGRVFLFTDDFVVVPGPRFIKILEKMAAVIQTEEVRL
ncbi:MAG: helical backbone metal receptor [Phycisphaerales bacterium]